MNRNYFLTGCAVSLALCFLLQVSSLADNALCNVAAFKPTEGAEAYGYATLYGVNDSAYSFTHGSSASNDYWRVDLGQEFDVEYLVIDSRTAFPQRTNWAFLQAFDSANNPVGSPIMLDGYSYTPDDPETPEDELSYVDSITWDNGGNGWQGVQYFQIGGEDGGGTPLGIPYLHVREFQAFADVECNVYEGFIDGVTATDNGTMYTGHSAVAIEFLTDSTGMTDKYGTINSPTAESYCTIGGLWHGSSDVSTENHPILTFDLGGSYSLDDMVVWNINQPSFHNRGFNEVIVRTSSDGVTFTDIADANGAAAGNCTFGMVPDTTEHGDTVGPQATIDLSGITASYVQIEALSSHGSDNYWGLSEVRFYEAIGLPDTPGDANRDGKVDGSDVTILAGNWQKGVSDGLVAIWGDGDFNGDGKVDGSDVTILAGNWQYGVTVATASVPEPNAIVILLCGLGGLCLLRLKRCR